MKKKNSAKIREISGKQTPFKKNNYFSHHFRKYE